MWSSGIEGGKNVTDIYAGDDYIDKNRRKKHTRTIRTVKKKNEKKKKGR